MTKISLAYDVVNLSPADANPVEANFNKIVNHINQELIERDGTVAMREQLRLVGNPINALDAAPKQYVDQVLPIGLMMPFAGTGSPPGGRWLLCDGTELQAADYPELFAVIGTSFVTGTPAAGRFNLPNMLNKFPMGASTVGAVGGTADQQVISHTHTNNHDHASFFSSFTSNNHQHQDTPHRHDVHIATGSENASHYHAPHAPFSSYVAFRGSGGSGNLAAGTQLAFDNTTDWDVGDHQHSVDGYTGTTGGADLTGGQSVDHRHTVDVPAYTGTTGATGAASVGTGLNLPPYLGLAFVIRAK